MCRGEGAKTSRCTQREQGCILPPCLCNTSARTMPALPQTNQQLEVASKITRSSSGNSAVEKGARKQGLRESLAKRPEGKRLADGEALHHHGWGGQEEQAQHSPACRTELPHPARLPGPLASPRGHHHHTVPATSPSFSK